MVSAMGIDICLSLCYLLMIKCQWKEEQFQNIRKYFYLVVWPIALGRALYLLIQHQCSLSSDNVLCLIGDCDALCRLHQQGAQIERLGVYTAGLGHMIFPV